MRPWITLEDPNQKLCNTDGFVGRLFGNFTTFVNSLKLVHSSIKHKFCKYVLISLLVLSPSLETGKENI
jgi:hypothetical protein